MKEYYNCFIGIPLDYEFFYEAEKIQKSMQKLIPSGAIVEPQNLHLTLYYLGLQTEEALEEISSIIYEDRSFIFPEELKLGGEGIFNRKIYSDEIPYVIYLKVGHTDRLINYRDKLKEHLEYFNKDEPREYTPHLTLLRLKTTEAFREFKENETEVRNILNQIKWSFKIKEIYIYGKLNLNSSKFQDTLFKVSII